MADLRTPSLERSHGAATLGIAAGAATAAFYGIGAGRAFGWDASNTVGHFVATRSLLDAFRAQRGFNNHVLFSALEHVVFTVTGSQDERLLRILPIAFGAAVVGLLSWLVARRLGGVPGAVAGLVVAANPVAIQEFREVRGYSLVVLCALVSTVLFVRLRRQRPPSRALVAGYCVVSALGVATHLSMVGVLGVQAAVVCRDRHSVPTWVPRLAAAVALGVAIAAVPLWRGFGTHQSRVFRPWFPLTLPYDLLGGEGVAFTALAPVVVFGVWKLRARRAVWRALAATAVIVLAAWAAGPAGLFTRYFLWLLPAVGVAAAVAVARRPALVILVIVAAGAQVITSWPELGEDVFPNRPAAAIVRAAQGAGLRACVVGSTNTTLAAYAKAREVRTQPELAECDVVVAADGTADQTSVQTAARMFPYSMVLPAEQPGNAFSRAPFSTLTSRPARAAP
ncbi:MAG: glycosyltransferase family 39 protein [Acidimicrobiia bacterium]|nr:glycosyltransferase family 39 protein [Acidimicrobiia bacterium]